MPLFKLSFNSLDWDLAERIPLDRLKRVALLKELHADQYGIVQAELGSEAVDIGKGCVTVSYLFSIYPNTWTVV